MKKYIIALPLFALMFTACDPSKIDLGSPDANYTASELENLFTVTQTDADGNPAADGNYFHFKTNNLSRPVQIIRIIGGSENVLAAGFEGDFAIRPTRGQDPVVSYLVRVVNFDGTHVDIEKNATVYVPQTLSQEMKVLCSNTGSKTWKWDTNAPGGQVWGNYGGDENFDGKGFAINGGAWWGVTSEEEFLTQGNHASDGFIGDESLESTMTFNEDGTVTCKKADGTVFRSGVFEIQDYDPAYANHTAYCGKLHTSSGAILWPYEINSGGNKPTDFYIAYLSATQLVLVYPDKGTWDPNDNNAGWGEGTFWRFSCADDVEGLLTDYDEATWEWDDTNGICWGNGGYSGLVYGGIASVSGNTWWGVPSSELADQVSNYGYGLQDVAGATMTFYSDGTLKKSSGGSGTFWVDTENKDDIGGYKEGTTLGRLNTTGDGILFPVRINAGTTVNELDIVYASPENLVLAYPNYPAGGDNASWMEGTFWRFKKK